MQKFRIDSPWFQTHREEKSFTEIFENFVSRTALKLIFLKKKKKNIEAELEFHLPSPEAIPSKTKRTLDSFVRFLIPGKTEKKKKKREKKIILPIDSILSIRLRRFMRLNVIA